MRTLASVIAAALVSFVALGASASEIIIEWTGTGGSQAISATPSDTVTASIFIDATADGGSTGYQIGVQFNPSVLQVVSATEIIDPAFNFNFIPGVNTLDNVNGIAQFWEAAIFGGSAKTGKFLVGTVVFHYAGGSTTVDGYLDPIDGSIIDAGGATTTVTSSGASISLVPEPGTALLLGLGLSGLAIASGRRDRK